MTRRGKGSNGARRHLPRPGNAGSQMRVLSTISAAILITLVASCANRPGLDRLGTAEAVPATQAMVFPAPGGPAITAVVGQHNIDGAQQTIALATHAATVGENYIKVRLITRAGGAIDNSPGDPPADLRLEDVRRALVSEFPGVAMTMSDAFVQNSFGPFGYATGTSPHGDGCVYAWQQIRAASSDQSILSNTGRIALRLRLCAAGQTPHQLIMTMYGLTIVAALDGHDWNPYGTPAPADPRLAAGSGPILPPHDRLVCATTGVCVDASPADQGLAALGTSPSPAPVARFAAAPQPIAPQPIAPQPTALPANPLPPPPAATSTMPAIPAPTTAAANAAPIAIPAPTAVAADPPAPAAALTAIAPILPLTSSCTDTAVFSCARNDDHNSPVP